MKFLKTFESFDSEMTAEEVYEMLKRDCPGYLELLSNCPIDDGKYYDFGEDYQERAYYEKEIPMLYRGTRAKTEDILSIEPRSIRRAKDTDQKVSDEIDDKFESIHGIRPRQSGVFSTQVRDVAGHYGNSYLFFPIGDFDYTWSNRIDDLFDELRNPPNKMYSWYLWEVDSNYRRNTIRSEVRSRFEKSSQEQFFDLIENKEVTGHDVDKFEKTFEEEMDVLMSKEKEKWMDEFIGTYNVNEGFCDVVKLKSEITFICDEYYIVEPRFENELKKLIFNLNL